MAEPDGSETFTISLSSQPTATVTIALSPSSSECAVDPDSLILTAANWDTGASASVSALDDSLVDGPQDCTILTAPAVSADSNYGGEDPVDLPVTVTDDDAAGFSLTPSSLSVAEPDGSETFTISLSSQPTATVTIALSPSSSECSVDPDSLILTAANWDTGASASVSALDDSLVDGPQDCTILTAPAVSADSNYGGEDPVDLPVTVTDDDAAGFSLTPSSLSVAEPDGSETFAISLSSQPTATVTIALSPSSSECAVDPDSLILTAANWDTGASASVSALDDSLVDGDQDCTIVTAPAVSSDTSYNGEDPADLPVTVTDDDAAGFSLTPSSLSVAEPDGSETFAISLSSQPTATVTIALSPSSSECSVDPDSLILTAANWDTGASASVSALDDSLVDGAQDCTILTAPAVSADSNYGGEDPVDLPVTVTDDDAAGFSLTPSSLSVAEPDGSETFTLSLSSQPTATVTIALSPSSSECSVDPDSLILTAANWDTGASASVSALDDSLVDGAQDCTILTAPAVSADSNYGGEDPVDLPVTVTDDDAAGFSLTPSSLSVAEPDGSETFAISLSSQPTATVTIALSPSSSECAVDPDSLILTAANWDTGASASVSALDDSLVDGDQDCTIVTAPAVSSRH